MKGLSSRIGLAIFVALAATQFASADEWHFSDAERVVAFSDVHGDYEAMVATLQSADILDSELSWSGGGTHFVLVGDILDRGPGSRAAMDLLMRIEEEAIAAGGRVHVLLGNHEIMNMIGDLRYVHSGEYAAFADEESAETRDYWYAAYREERDIDGPDDEQARAKFDKAYPAGYFAHFAAFAPDGQYGSWLESKPMIVVVNDTAFVHGGLSPTVAEIGLQGINGDLLDDVRLYSRQMRVLTDAHVLLPTDRNRDHVKILQNFKLKSVQTKVVKQAMADVTRLNDGLFSYQSPHWYRGHTYCTELIEGDRVDASLKKINAARVVVGHTPTPNREVVSRLGGRVIEVDTGMNSKYYKGSGHALILENDEISVIREGKTGTVTPLPSAREVGSRPGKDLSAEAIEELLRNGEIVVPEMEGAALQVVSGDQTLAAKFIAAKRKNVYPDTAAYRLDRLLKLDMVPVTVVREYDGKRGSLQFLPGDTMNEAQRQAEGIGGGAWCPLPVQWPNMTLFDTLAGNSARSADTLLYNLDAWQLILVGFDNAFTTSTAKPTYLRDGRIKVGPSWNAALKSLDNELLQATFEDVLDKRRIKALGKRRDLLLSE